MKKKLKIMIKIIVFVLIFMGVCSIVNADEGPKPSITIKVTNIDTTDYLIDLLVFDETGENYGAEVHYNGMGLTEEEVNVLHNLNYDGWISESTRWYSYLLMADCKGNENFEHYFTYFGTPDTYKIVIINNKTGETKLTDVIHRKDFTSTVELDFNTMKTTNVFKISSTIIKFIVAILVTIIAEVLVAYIMKIKEIKLIALVNLITNILLQAVLYIVKTKYIVTFIIMEIVVIILEHLIYKKFLKDISNKKIIIYTIVANSITIILTFLIPIIALYI